MRKNEDIGGDIIIFSLMGSTILTAIVCIIFLIPKLVALCKKYCGKQTNRVGIKVVKTGEHENPDKRRETTMQKVEMSSTIQQVLRSYKRTGGSEMQFTEEERKTSRRIYDDDDLFEKRSASFNQ